MPLVAHDAELPGHQIEFVGLDVGGGALLEREFFFGKQSEFQRRDDGI
ncbi:MAG TPA: hypothetical protein VNF99_15590 [Stellaceae bacterium]|nr:hypothetical protein [Stellaceae bacterium]